MRIGSFDINFDSTLRQPFFFISGPCVIESEKIAIESAIKLKTITQKLGIDYIYKTSFEKANRTSLQGYRGPGFAEGLRILAKIKQEVQVPILVDVHEYTPIDEVVAVVDVLQTPAFLCRQTNFIQKVASYKKPVNLKKGQFLSPWEMQNVVDKARAVGNNDLMVCERGVSFGYNNLVVDMRSLSIMRQIGVPVIFDAGHSVQLPGAMGCATGGNRELIPVLARAAVGAGVDGLFLETHPDPDHALCDGPNSWPLDQVEELLVVLQELDQAVKHK
jgi:2-dehydro-3-deoxyphosphooctonate aldolase (KDO 8-P synthase)